MPKPLNYTDDELCELARILVEKSREKNQDLKKKLEICEVNFEAEYEDEISELRVLITKLNKAIKVLTASGEQRSKEKKRSFIFRIFDERCKAGSKLRNRITARVRASKRTKRGDESLVQSFSPATKRALAQLRGFKEFDKNLSPEQIVLKLIALYKAAQAKKVAEKRKNN
jgi:hypothetical protein